MKSYSLSLVLLVLVSTARGDQLVVTGQTKEGNFQGYENGRFQLVTKKGRFVKEQAGRVTKLVLDAPMKVSYTTSDGKQEPTAELKGYDKRTFTFTKGGSEVAVPQAKMKIIELVIENEGGGQDEGTRYPIPEVNLDDFVGPDITPAQQVVIDKFKAAKKTFDDYVEESTALVREMDKQTGVKREELLNKLRARKNEEQPLRKALISAYKALADAFPEPADEPAAKPDKSGNGEKPKTSTKSR